MAMLALLRISLSIAEFNAAVALAALDFPDDLRVLLHDCFEICSIEGVPHALLLSSSFWILPQLPLHVAKDPFPTTVEP